MIPSERVARFIPINLVTRVALAAILIVGFFCHASCNREPAGTGPVYRAKDSNDKTRYRFAVHPLHNPALLFQAYQPLMAYLEEHLPQARFILEASKNYAGFEAKFKDGRLAFLLPNPWQTLQAGTFNYEVIAMAGDPRDFKGIFIVRKDSPLKTPADLKCKTVSYPAPTALAACIMPQYFLFAHGLDISSDLQNSYVGSQESSIMNVFLKQSDAGATWPPPWRLFQENHPDKARELNVIWQTPYLMNNSVMALSTLPDDLKQAVQTLLITLHTHSEGLSILKSMETSRFYKADNSDYNVVQSYIESFEKNVRKVKTK